MKKTIKKTEKRRKISAGPLTPEKEEGLTRAAGMLIHCPTLTCTCTAGAWCAPDHRQFAMRQIPVPFLARAVTDPDSGIIETPMSGFKLHIESTPKCHLKICSPAAVLSSETKASLFSPFFKFVCHLNFTFLRKHTAKCIMYLL